MSLEKRKIIMKTFVKSQFNYLALIWMLESYTLNNMSPNISYSYFKSSLNTLLEDDSFSIHDKNIQVLAIEIYKYFHFSLQVLWATL